MQWKSYFDIIAAVNEFILYDDMRYIPHECQIKIKMPKYLKWLTASVLVKDGNYQKIRETEIFGADFPANYLLVRSWYKVKEGCNYAASSNQKLCKPKFHIETFANHKK